MAETHSAMGSRGGAMEAKDLIPIVSAFIGVVAALFTALGAFYTYKAKLAEKASPVPQPTPVKILSIRDRPPTNVTVLVAKGGAYFGIAWGLFFGALVLLLWSDVEWSLRIVGIATFLIIPLFIFVLFKLRGDLSKRSSRTKYDTTVTVMAPYDVVFSRCQDILQRRKATIFLVDYDGGLVESLRGSYWWMPLKFNIRVSRVGDDRCSVYVESDSRVPTAIIDFGTNRRQVRRFVRDLTL
jgi:hypothetical protein